MSSTTPEKLREMIDATEKAQPKAKPDPKLTPYTEELWKGVRSVYKCSTCTASRDSEDEIILHVLKHVPESEQEKLLAKLIKEKQHAT